MDPTQASSTDDRFPVDLWEGERVTVLEALDAFLATNPPGKLARIILVKNKIASEREHLKMNDAEMQLVKDALHPYRPAEDATGWKAKSITALINRFTFEGVVRFNLSEYGSWEKMPADLREGLEQIIETINQKRQEIRDGRAVDTSDGKRAMQRFYMAD